MKQDYRNPPAPGENPDERLSKSNDIEDFFQKMSGNFRWPKPDAESVALPKELKTTAWLVAAFCLQSGVFVFGAALQQRERAKVLCNSETL